MSLFWTSDKHDDPKDHHDHLKGYREWLEAQKEAVKRPVTPKLPWTKEDYEWAKKLGVRLD